MQLDETYRVIKEREPGLVFVTGKTSTGKSTFAKRLRDELGYRIIELDQIVMKSVVHKQQQENTGSIFLQVYRGGERRDWIDAFVTETKKEIAEHSAEKLVVEGALAHNETLDEIFAGHDFLFLYFHPTNEKTYVEMLTQRFVDGAHNGTTGLPKHFWDIVDDVDVKEFLETQKINDALRSAISLYARSSIKQSEERFKYFQEHFPKILNVSI